ncbi:MAG: (Fe-S)-binding protein, partial [Alistipes sp.]|nr:(Fe-S)-binding protein [Alistipes sp.]
SSLANTVIDDKQQLSIATNVAEEMDSTGAKTLVTACPLCKKAIARGTRSKVVDLSEIVAGNLR